jgi:ribosomal protein L14E/L6E/L27E
MKNILIDTCSWINLLSEDSNKLLPHLEFWKNNNCIRIISHEKVIEEWNFHKEEHKKRLSDSLNAKYMHTKAIAKKEGLLIPEALSPNFDEIENQIKLIDDLLVDSHVLETPSDVKVFCADWQITKKAPFHNKPDSMKDAYIIFTAIKHFTEIGEEFIFISDNKNDFGSLDNPDTEIHPQIIEKYSEVCLRYFKDIGRAINTLKQEISITLLPEDINISSVNNIEDEIIIDKTKPILEQVYDYISIRHKEIKFYPISLFINHYPLKINSFNYYSTFNLNTDNEELIELFKSVKISEDNKISITDEKFYNGVKNYEAKIKATLLGFSANLIFNITSNKSREQLSIRYSEEKNCECPKCSFKKFKFSECFKSLDTYTNSKEDLQESSYLNYQIGNYVFAVEKQKSALVKYKKKHLNTSYFIGQFNLSKLSIFVRNNYFGENSQNELVKELKAIDLEYEETNLSSKENKKLIKFLKENTFYADARNKIQETSSKLIDQYYSSLNGGWSSNSDVWILINEFAKLETFLVDNFIVYDKFKEFKDVFSIFIEGLFASHAISDPHHSRLENFDDWLIANLIQYGNPEIINKYYRRYKLKKIHYKKTSSNGDSFSELIDNFLSNVNLRESLVENCESNNRWFWEYYNKIFQNLLTLVSISDFDKTFINSFSKQLISYLENETFIHHQSFKQINLFLYRCGKHLDKELILRFFELGISKPFYHNSDFYDSLLNTIENKRESITISEKQFQIIKNIAFDECSLCKEKHQSSIIIPLYLMIDNSDFKKEIGSIIQEKLQESFSFDLFYLATIFELIPLDKDMLGKAIEMSLPKSKQASLKSVFSGVDDKRFDRLNSILNLCFKFDIDTTTEKFEPFKNLDSYYAWLIDMDNFNYDLFETEWIGEYATIFYYRKIHNNKFVKEKLDGIIKNKFDSSLERDYLNIYVRKTWNLKD